MSSIKNAFTSNEVLYSKLRPYLRKFYKPTFSGVCSSEFWVFSPKKITQSFLYHFISTNRFNIQTNKTCGTKMPRADWNKIKKLDFYYPNNETQDKISAFLDAIDEKIELLTLKIEALKKYKRGFIKHLLLKGIKTEKFVNYIKYISKSSFSSSYGKDKGKYPFYINSTDGSYKFIDSYTHEGKHLILNTGGQAFTQISEEKFSAMADNLIIKVHKNLYGVYYYLKCNETRINYVGFQGTGIKHLDQNWLKRQYVILPSISEEKIEALENGTNSIIKLLECKLEKLHQLKTQLMKDLFI